tara:strand:- start:2031 stop:2228 length:198 start_codon:yes stop_codon:yes gene_type:complete
MEDLYNFLYKIEEQIELTDDVVNTSELYELIKNKVTPENKTLFDLILSYYSLGMKQNNKYRRASP